MNKLLKIITFTTLLGFVACSAKEETSTHSESKVKTYYTCSMHPQIKEDKPGKCPICHMNLTKVEVEDDHDHSAMTQNEPQKDLWRCKDFPDVTSEKEDVCPMDGSPMVKVNTQKENASKVVASVKLRKSQLKHFNPSYFPVTTMKMTKKIRLLGQVLQSEEKESNIPARIDGRVEKVYVKSTGSFVKTGDPVVDIYSPKLISAGEEYILARKTYLKNKGREFRDLYLQSQERLELWGIKKEQYEAWAKSGAVPNKITIYSPATGIVQKRSATVGTYFKEGQNFFELSNLSDVWVELDVYEQDSALVQLGQTVELEFIAIPGKTTKGEVDFISPVLDQQSRTLKVRATIQNEEGKLKPGMVANAQITFELEGMPLVIPRSAVIDTGKRKVAWVKVSDKEFKSVVIKTGHESEGYVEVKEGLKDGDQVVIEGNFLLDAQAQLFGGYEDMSTSDPHQGHTND
ncbi:efflux RND transporter periplasmic adaptor subunit [Halobacteriovorax sp. DA5]|uniref:efflux RND transporter periplasmic adaptor subunit n=1 Tax=Halobacteriovorax sp. DA5 TaxID=2067553 RepID=UPI000CD189B2|nr:efflux RND transporter periplasmic adaptor subunit [Halobacteriovorax sp. DA5]POB13410.1 efflux RND transporter periplasmic adaptor subunit [Halobacteriovorax sp. DA5]